MNRTVSFLAGAAAFLLAGSALAQTAGLVMHLPCDEGKGNVANDVSGVGNHARLEGKAGWGDAKSAEFGKALTMGQGAFATVAHHDSLNLTKAMTLMCWVKIDQATGDNQSGMEKGPAWAAGEYNLLPVYGNQILLQIFDLPEPCNDDLQAGNVMDQLWHHIAGTWDGKAIRIYQDGVEVRKGDCEGVLNTNNGFLYIGARGGTGRFTMGSYDELKIFNRALDEDEIAKEMLPPKLAVYPQDKASTAWGALKLRAGR